MGRRMGMVKRIVFEVTDEIAEQLTRRAVYLDVFGGVCWTDDYTLVIGATNWWFE